MDIIFFAVAILVAFSLAFIPIAFIELFLLKFLGYEDKNDFFGSETYYVYIVFGMWITAAVVSFYNRVGSTLWGDNALADLVMFVLITLPGPMWVVLDLTGLLLGYSPFDIQPK